MQLPEPSTYPAELFKFQRFCARLKLPDGGRLELEDFQLRILADFFAGVTETLVLLSKKNGKTTLLAALGLWHLLSWPKGANPACYIAAASRDQATTLFEQAVGFVDRSPGLQRRLLVRGGFREIRLKGQLGKMKVLAADVDTTDGLIPTLALIDELGRHKKPDLYGVLRDGLGPRNGRLIGISAAGEHETSPLGTIRTAARLLPTVTDGKYLYARSKHFALHEWALNEAVDDLDDMAVVKLVNPASWQTEDKLRTRHDSPSTFPWQWKRFACGIWTAPDAFWLDPEDWTATESGDQLQPGDAIALGFDGSRFHDATALVACRLSDGLLQLLGLWERPEGLEGEWEVPGSAVDAVVADAMETFSVVRGYFDPPLWQSEIDAWAREYGDEVVLRYWTNRSRFLVATERFRTDLQQRVFPHAKNVRLTAHVLNAQLVPSRGGYVLTKGREKIDAAIAGVLAYEARCDALAASGDADRTEYAFL